MIAFFATPGMLAVFVTVALLQALSLAAMGAVLLAFHRVRRKQEVLLCTLQQAPLAPLRQPVLAWVYIVMTVSIAIASLSFLFFQSHLS